MFALSGPFEGIMVDLQEGDIPGVQANFEAFKAQYEKVSGMVPEWTDRFPMEPVEALGQALASGDPAQVGPAMGGVGGVCGSCHMLDLVKAQQKYHWPDFETVELTDPLSGESMHLSDYMMAMAGAFAGVGNDLQQGQVDAARQNFQAFSARFNALAENACKQCHKDQAGKEIPRTYFVDDSVMGMIDQLGQAVAANPPNGQAIGQLSGAIGTESCMKCHLVHLPAATAKNRWATLADAFK
jgi:cytochrome c556